MEGGGLIQQLIYLHVAFGGILGALARFALGSAVGAPGPGSFPWTTFAINLTGSVLLGFLVRALPAWDAPEHLRALLTVGFCGSFTTFSTFGYEAVTLWTGGAPETAAAYVAASLGVGLAAVVAGLWIGGLAA